MQSPLLFQGLLNGFDPFVCHLADGDSCLFGQKISDPKDAGLMGTCGEDLEGRVMMSRPAAGGRVDESFVGMIDRDQLFFNSKAIEKGNDTYVAFQLNIRYKADGQTLMNGTEIADGGPDMVGGCFDSEFSIDGGHRQVFVPVR